MRKRTARAKRHTFTNVGGGESRDCRCRRPVGAGAAGDRPAKRTTAGRVGPTTTIRVGGGLRVGRGLTHRWRYHHPPSQPPPPGKGDTFAAVRRRRCAALAEGRCLSSISTVWPRGGWFEVLTLCQNPEPPGVPCTEATIDLQTGRSPTAPGRGVWRDEGPLLAARRETRMGALRPGRGRIPAVKELNDTGSPGWPR